MNDRITAQGFANILRDKLDPEILEPVAHILAASLAAVDPYQAVRRQMELQGDRLLIAGNPYPLDQHKRIIVVSFGKAAAAMALAVHDILEARVTAGIVVDKVSDTAPQLVLPDRYRVIHSNHPLPGEASLNAGRAVLELLQTCRAGDLVLFLISGGGSSLITAIYEGISLADLQALNQLLLQSGAAIEEINTVRKHLDRVKGGGLARAASPAKFVSLVLSDVVGNPLASIASGPTVADPGSFEDAIEVLRSYDLWEQVPGGIRNILLRGQQGEIPETLNAGDPALEGCRVALVGSNEIAAQAALAAARQRGFEAAILTNSLQGEAFAAGEYLAGMARRIAHEGQPLARPACLIAGGETTVVVQGDGLGGRNLEVALGAVETLAGLPRVAVVTLATDGEDGPTDAAGAVVTGQSLGKAQALGLSVEQSRRRNDSYHFFEGIDALFKTGSTGTNVNDLSFIFVY